MDARASDPALDAPATAARGGPVCLGSVSRSVALVILLHSASGCSWAFMRPPPKAMEQPSAPVECTSSPVPPVLDGLCAVSLGILTGVLLTEAATAPACEGGMAPCVSAGAYVAGAVLVGAPAVVCGISGVSGAKKASRCVKIKNVNAACIDGDDAACQRLKSGRLDAMNEPFVPDDDRSSTGVPVVEVGPYPAGLAPPLTVR